MRTSALFSSAIILSLAAGCSDMGSPPVEPLPELTVVGDTVNEGETAECEIQLSFAPSLPVTFVYSLVGVTATPGADFVARTDTITIEADDHDDHDEDHVHISFPIAQDSEPEELEEISIVITQATNATIARGAASCFVLDDDGAPLVTVSDPIITEGEIATFVVTLNIPSTIPVTFEYVTSAGTASSPADFAAVSGSGTIPAGETEITIPVITFDDVVSEGTESFTLSVSNLSGAEPLKPSGTCTIGDNEAAPVSFAADIRPILNDRCVNCHNSNSNQRDFSVSSYNEVLNSGDRGPHVTPGHSAHSTLYLVLLLPPPSGFIRMPQGGALPAAEISKIKDWIDQGALNN